MKDDFTRDTYNAGNHFTRVLLQQGRVQLDADWNEQAAILLRYLRALAADLIGPHGGPADNLGFGMIVDPNAIDALKDANGNSLDADTVKFLKDSLQKNGFLIGIGHYYVNGLLCQNDTYLGFAAQAGYPFAQSAALDELKKSKDSFIVFLDVWERYVSYLQDDSIRETALGGPDTAGRAQAAWQVRAPALTSAEQKQLQKLVDTLKKAGNDAAKVAAATKNLNEFADSVRKNLMVSSSASLRVRLMPGSQSDDPCIIDPDSAFRGAANQLYRVEVHTGGGKNEATFKWSRDNGSVAAAWLESEGNDQVVGAARNFAAGQWVEFTDEVRELRGEPGLLVKLTKVEGDTLTIDPASTQTTPAWNANDVNPIVRRWDQRATDAISLSNGAVPIKEGAGDGDWIDLEDGIQIQFLPPAGTAARQYRTGDYWLIPARAATGMLEWPTEHGPDGKEKRDSRGTPIPRALPPHGVEHRYAPLAVVDVDDAGKVTVQLDLRHKIALLGV